MPTTEIERLQERHAQDMARRAGPDDDRLESEKVVVAAPFSFAGSAQRIWPYFKRRADAAKERSDETKDALIALSWGTLGVLTIGLAWTGVMSWYVIFGLLVVPYRLIRRGQRKRQVEALRQRELLAAVANGHPATEGHNGRARRVVDPEYVGPGPKAA